VAKRRRDTCHTIDISDTVTSPETSKSEWYVGLFSRSLASSQQLNLVATAIVGSSSSITCFVFYSGR
jgi:hypothetical protein